MSFRTILKLQGACFLWVLSAFGQSMPAMHNGVLFEGPLKRVVVEDVSKGSKAEKAGFQQEDILLNWARGEAQGEIESPFDLLRITIDEASQGAVRVEGLRGAEPRVWILESDTWGITARPNLPAPLLTIYRDGAELIKQNKVPEAAERWRALALQAENSRSPWLRSWLLFHAAECLAHALRWKEADDYYRESVEQAKETRPAFKAQLLQDWARTYKYRNDWANAEKYHLEALAERREAGVETMSLALSFEYLGLLAVEQGELARAEEYYHQCVLLQEKLAPGSLYVASTLNNLGILYYERGDLARAESYHRQALAIEKKVSPSSHAVAVILTGLAFVAHARNDLAKAEDYEKQALRIMEGVAPDGLEVASCLSKLGDIVLDLGDQVQAEKYYRQGLAIRQKLAPDGLDTAMSLGSLGELAQRRGDGVQAEKYYRLALGLKEKAAPKSLYLALTLKELGDVIRSRGDLVEAEKCYRRALSIQEQTAPQNKEHAETLAALGGLMRAKHELDVADPLYQQALDVLESQTAHLGGADEDHSRFRARYSDYYTNYAELLIAEKHPDRAFEVLERSRARTLLEMLRTGQINIRQGVDAGLLAREHSLRDSITAKTNRRVALLGDKHTEEQITVLDKEIKGLLSQLDDVEAQIRLNSPAYAALTQPQPLGLKEIQEKLLDKNTVLLEYSLGEERSYLFVVSSTSLAVHELPKRSTIERAAQRVYELLTERNRQKNEAQASLAEQEYVKSAARLSRMLLAPAATELRGNRLLIVSDGVLHYVPFAALPSPGNTSLPLIVHHEIVSLPSASVLAVLRQEAMGRKLAPRTVAVLADPVFDREDVRVKNAAANQDRVVTVQLTRGAEDQETEEAAEAESLTRSVADMDATVGSGVYLPRLQLTRQEAKSILGMTPRGEGIEALDFKASRATVMSPALAEYRIVHFATHGLLNSKHPELSGLVLSLVDEQGRPQNGFLGLQDIYNLNLPAELVVLSACETGLGKNIQGEGLIGLTRGFMYAGATRVVASLWKIDDLATAELMARFYRGMEQQGMRPAAALRAAQIYMWKQKRWQSPYYWAAFQIHGEWK